jgi:peptidoglycan/LPS O-acetylase OafA/YrhL
MNLPVRMAKSGTVALGDWSYSLYLAHIFVLQSLQRIFARLADLPGETGALFDVPGDGHLGNLVFLVACIVLSTIVAWLSYRFLERPMLQQFNKARRALFTRPDTGVRPVPVQAAIW